MEFVSEVLKLLNLKDTTITNLWDFIDSYIKSPKSLENDSNYDEDVRNYGSDEPVKKRKKKRKFIDQ